MIRPRPVLALALLLGCSTPASQLGPEPDAPPSSAPANASATSDPGELVLALPTDSQEPPMPPIDFGLSDSDYWNDPTEDLDAVIEELWKLERDATALGAPKFVALDQRETLPLVVVRGAPYSELYTLDYPQYAVLTLVRLEHNVVNFGPVYYDEDELPAEPKDPEEIPSGHGSENYLVDLREELGVEWQPSTLVATVIVRDKVSNRVRIELGKSPGAYHDEEVARFLAEHARESEPPAVNPRAGNPVPSYAKLGGSPPIPDEPGVALATTRVTLSRPGASSMLYGAFRLPVLPHERVKDGARASFGSGRDEAPAAIVGITLIITASDEPFSEHLRLDVPSWELSEGETPMATGYFALDLLGAKLIGPRAQTYFVYALSGEQLTGPAPAALVAESQLPPG